MQRIKHSLLYNNNESRSNGGGAASKSEFFCNKGNICALEFLVLFSYANFVNPFHVPPYKSFTSTLFMKIVSHRRLTRGPTVQTPPGITLVFSFIFPSYRFLVVFFLSLEIISMKCVIILPW